MSKITEVFKSIHSKINWNILVSKVAQLGKISNSMVSKYHFFRKLTLVIALWIAGWTTYQMFIDITLITGAAASAYLTATGLLAVAIGFFFRGSDDDEEDSEK